jgi:hypothetical protein
MEFISLASLSAFLGACLLKAGEKFSEKSIETVFEHKSELADVFTGLFQQEIITLGLNDTTTPEEVKKQIELNPEVALQGLKKIADKPELLAEFNKHLTKETGGMTINAKSIGQVVKENYGTINQTITFT